MSLTVFNCFCTGSEKSGNPAVVVTDFTDDDVEKAKLAKQYNLPVTIFIADLNAPMPELRYFYPLTEMPLCLHGTLAAAEFLFQHRKVDHIICITSAGKKLDITKNQQEIIQIAVTAEKTNQIDIDKNIIAKMLNLDDARFFADNLPFLVTSVGSPKLLVPINLLLTLKNLKLNYPLIKDWSIGNNVNGLYVYTRQTNDPTFNYHARGFNPKGGYNEDAATGVAAAALALALKQDIAVEQGDSMETLCGIYVTYVNDKKILVGGIVRQVTITR